MATRIKHRRDTTAGWAAQNPILGEGEFGWITDVGRFKVGDGVTEWNDLDYPLSLDSTFTLGTFQEIAEPSAPDLGELHFYAKKAGGRMLPRFKGPSGLDSALQPAIFGNGMFMASPGNNAAMNVLGGPPLTNVGTATHPALTTSSLRQQTSRANIRSDATADSVASTRLGFGRVWRGDAAGLGGFFFRMRFAINSSVATQRMFFGLYTNAVIAVTAVPSALLNLIGVANDGSAEENLQIITNSAAGTADKIDLGSDFPSMGVEDVYELTLFCPPNESFIDYSIQRLGNGAIAEGRITGPKLPVTSAFLAPYAYMNNGGTAAVVNFDLMRIYLETDF